MSSGTELNHTAGDKTSELRCHYPKTPRNSWSAGQRYSAIECGRAGTPGVLLALDEALTRLEEFDPRQARIVELLYFSGMTQPEAAKALDVSPRTINREWRTAQAWLREEVAKDISE